MIRSVLILVAVIQAVQSLNNGLVLTPPMGWLTWERYRCIIDCETRPDECISEKLITDVADELVNGGYLAAGYEYVGIDDCWMEKKRSDDGKLVPDKTRFPRGMKYIADYLHKKGLKFGIYEDYGNFTCAGYPGILGHMEIDAATFGEWEADYVKLDGCYVDIDMMDEGYPYFGKLLNDTGRKMLYSCSWPVYQEENGMMPNFTSIIEHCNMWRNYDDIDDSWWSVVDIMEYFGSRSERLASYAGPGHWNDPDMLIIGNFGLSYDQSKVQMAVWAILAAPLLISADLKRMKPEFKEILLNKELIAIDQDLLGRQGIRISTKNKKVFVWKREIAPIKDGVPSLALAIVNLNDDGAPRPITVSFDELKINSKNYYSIDEILPSDTQSWRLDLDRDTEVYNINSLVNPTGVIILKMTIKNVDKSENVITS